MTKPAPRVTPAIMSGGAGSRLWPLSRRLYPKQLLPLASERSMIQETVARFDGAAFESPIVICNQEHRFLIAEQLREVHNSNALIALEPVGRNTAPVAAVAALLASRTSPDAIVLLVPSDHVIGDAAAFRSAVARGVPAAQAGALVTFGIKPAAPETGYGYILRGDALPFEGCYRVARFVEKPDRATAESYVNSGAHYWNSGMFLFAASALLAEMERLEPEMLAAVKRAVAKGRKDMDFFRLDEQAFEASPSRSIDYAIMEHAANAAVVPADMRWSDVGSWQSLWDIAAKNPSGNAMHGDVVAERVTNSYLRSDGPLLAAVGIEDVVVVATKDAVLVSHRDSAQDVKKLVDTLDRQGREHHVQHPKVYRPWGSYEGIDAGDRFQVKRIIVNPGGKLSLQMHHHRAEHWIVVRGTARVTCGDEVFLLHENQSTYIPIGTRHRLENPGKVPLHLIEVQSGTYLGEDDIVRIEDTYGRVEEPAK
jgi:mannose-1-phosphate guanylyltransferase/mannose-6-phosphate isomerase